MEGTPEKPCDSAAVWDEVRLSTPKQEDWDAELIEVSREDIDGLLVQAGAIPGKMGFDIRQQLQKIRAHTPSVDAPIGAPCLIGDAWRQAVTKPFAAVLEMMAAASVQEQAANGEGQSTTPPPVDLRKTKVKRSVLLAMSDRWETVASDFQHAKENGLDEAAKAPEHGMWFLEAALDWAKRHGKLRSEPSSASSKSSVFHWCQ